MVKLFSGIVSVTFHTRYIWTYYMFKHNHFNQNNDRIRM